MKKSMPKPYDEFRLNRIREPEYRHLLRLIFWPVYLVFFFATEKIFNDYHEIHCALDDQIPFLKVFVLPYFTWFIFQAWMILYTMIHDIPVFKRLMGYYIVTFSLATLCFIVYPTCHTMRPDTVEGRDVYSFLVRFLYRIDEPRDICPSEHVIGAFAVVFAALRTKRYSKPGWAVFVIVLAVLISLSTVFVKQHSAVDVFFAIPFCVLGWFVCFRRKKQEKL